MGDICNKKHPRAVTAKKHSVKQNLLHLSLEHLEGENRRKEEKKSASLVHKGWLSCGKTDFGSTQHPVAVTKAPLSDVKKSKPA